MRKAAAYLAALAAFARGEPRVRREIRTLSTAEFDALVGAMWTMKTLDDASGKARFGPHFRTYDSFVAQHVAAMTAMYGINAATPAGLPEVDQVHAEAAAAELDANGDASDDDDGIDEAP